MQSKEEELLFLLRLSEVTCHLDGVDLYRLGRVCKRAHDLIFSTEFDSILWKRVCINGGQTHFRMPYVSKKPQERDQGPQIVMEEPIEEEDGQKMNQYNETKDNAWSFQVHDVSQIVYIKIISHSL